MLVCIVCSREVCLAVRLVSCKKLWQISPWWHALLGDEYFEILWVSEQLASFAPSASSTSPGRGSEPHVKDVKDLHEGMLWELVFTHNRLWALLAMVARKVALSGKWSEGYRPLAILSVTTRHFNGWSSVDPRSARPFCHRIQSMWQVSSFECSPERSTVPSPISSLKDKPCHLWMVLVAPAVQRFAATTDLNASFNAPDSRLYASLLFGELKSPHNTCGHPGMSCQDLVMESMISAADSERAMIPSWSKWVFKTRTSQRGNLPTLRVPLIMMVKYGEWENQDENQKKSEEGGALSPASVFQHVWVWVWVHSSTRTEPLPSTPAVARLPKLHALHVSWRLPTHRSLEASHPNRYRHHATQVGWAKRPNDSAIPLAPHRTEIRHIHPPC